MAVDKNIPSLWACSWEGAHAGFVLMICTRGCTKNAQPEETDPHVLSFPKPLVRKVTPLWRTKQYGAKSKIQPHGNMEAGRRRMASCVLEYMNQFYYICIVSTSRGEVLFWVGSVGFFLYTTSMYFLTWSFLYVFSASHLVWGRSWLSFPLQLLGEFFSLALFKILAK